MSKLKKDETAKKMTAAAYQDNVDEGGVTTAAGYRSCADRYEIVRKAAQGLRRPFTVLDLGAASGYFSIRLTQDFGARVVAVERTPVIKAAIGRVAAIDQRTMDPEMVRKLGTYDMVLGLSFLHHIRDWKGMLNIMNRITRSALIIETPNPRERLRVAVNRQALGAIDTAVRNLPEMRQVGSSSGVWQRDLPRSIYLLKREGLPVEGKVFSGSGNNAIHMERFCEDLEAVLGYVPFPGSLNVRTRRIFRLGAYATEYVDPRRGRGGRGGGDYQIWHARVEGYDGPAHVMRPGARTHGRGALEVWAPVKLKDALGLKDGDRVTLRIGA